MRKKEPLWFLTACDHHLGTPLYPHAWKGMGFTSGLDKVILTGNLCT
jgi:hypothetical protein